MLGIDFPAVGDFRIIRKIAMIIASVNKNLREKTRRILTYIRIAHRFLKIYRLIMFFVNFFFRLEITW